MAVIIKPTSQSSYLWTHPARTRCNEGTQPVLLLLTIIVQYLPESMSKPGPSSDNFFSWETFANTALPLGSGLGVLPQRVPKLLCSPCSSVHVSPALKVKIVSTSFTASGTEASSHNVVTQTSEWNEWVDVSKVWRLCHVRGHKNWSGSWGCIQWPRRQ